MQIQIEISGQNYRVDLDSGQRISIPQTFDERQPRHFGAAGASKSPLRLSGFVGDTVDGGSCNVDQISIIPHCNGTHTECAGHILHDNLTVNQVLDDVFLPATLITVSPIPARSCRESYLPELQAADQLITAGLLQQLLTNVDSGFIDVLVIRTLPNLSGKCYKDYSDGTAPFFSLEAIDYISSIGVNHLMVDIPSVDRTFDGGMLRNHRRFWDIAPGEHVSVQTSTRTISELIYVPDDVTDGAYLAHIQLPDLALDAIPSRIWLFKVNPLSSTG